MTRLRKRAPHSPVPPSRGAGPSPTVIWLRTPSLEESTRMGISEVEVTQSSSRGLSIYFLHQALCLLQHGKGGMRPRESQVAVGVGQPRVAVGVGQPLESTVPAQRAGCPPALPLSKPGTDANSAVPRQQREFIAQITRQLQPPSLGVAGTVFRESSWHRLTALGGHTSLELLSLSLQLCLNCALWRANALSF